ncbi:hypothetical protein GCM10027271_43750 [Saccharopolyspora gloriosae]|uniref:Uncharacterized protein n=1 Tax=Saccharopolyspora gloriosae TaxID=455344 RepID=A0A840NJW1_9PSEU|nr:hypothetical protein [Saccharopolyspora gloriosae]MBB5070325.1 hypothetical protein [Saccharopolyspora gloriosae]
MGFSVRRFRWVPLILLVLGVVVMHHVPAHSAAHRAPSAHSALGAVPAEHPPTAVPESAEHEPAAALGSAGHPAVVLGVASPERAGAAEHEVIAAPGASGVVLDAPAMPAHDPLHLCLAILAGLAMLLLPLLGGAIRPVPVVAGSAAVPVRSRPRAPPSVPRRLALLCVLRR